MRQINEVTAQVYSQIDRIHRTPLFLASQEVMAWISHGKKEGVLDDPFKHRIVLDNFTLYRAAVEKNTWKCDRSSAYVIASWLTLAAYEHDIYENERDPGSEKKISAELWPKCQEALQFRYLYGLALVQNNLQSLPPQLPRGLHKGVCNTWNKLDIFKMIKAGFKFDDNQFDGLREKSARLADLEVEFWQAHHFRNNNAAIVVYSAILRELGYSDPIAIEASNCLVSTYKYHDIAEDSLKDNPNSPVFKYWALALFNLVKYFKILNRNV